jgi:hypothetical protein
LISTGIDPIAPLFGGAEDATGAAEVAVKCAGKEGLMAKRQIGVVKDLFRYPAKSMQDERLSAIDIVAHGVIGDRAYALREANGCVVTAKKWANMLEFSASQPDELQTWAGILTGPDGNPLVALIPCYVGSLDEGERVLAPLRRFGCPVADTVAPIPYVAMQAMFDAALAPGRLDYWKTGLTDRLDDEIIAATVDHARQAPSPLSVILFAELHGAYSRVAKTDTAYYHRDLQYDPIVLAIWTDLADSPRNIRWARELFAA